MRVLQLIDSLHPGGAERVAVNIANALVSKIEVSYLCATREEGLLKESINPQVNYLFLNKTKTIDAKAIKTLSAFVKQNKIDVIHAHSTSFFLASILKTLNKNLKIIWHDHFGNRATSSKINTLILKQCSKSFSQIFCVNENLVNWSKQNLKCKLVSFMPNFVVKQDVEPKTQLKGKAGKRIILLANLRPDKDYFNAIDAFKIIYKNNPEWSLHCVGKSFEDAYSKAIIDKVKVDNLDKSIFFYGSISDVSNALNQSNVGILSSLSEGLPMALLEYGFAGLPVVVTNVGDCGKVILKGELGILIPPKNSVRLANGIQNYIDNLDFAKQKGEAFKKHVTNHFSSRKIINTLITNYNTILEL
ncbi:glycosyltransferase involved in cell wall biosynthesis [Lacinutrix venerupis]|uniref:glycosyltransferase family 4 protein n=1 Tax=Lacinutrix venerupis TaxID=1486034 RepID=UPI000EAD32C5|nr:glycosyltransferase family 4 protein [Lacinutrix venerupis]RLJ64363.1 glycosyltransferase involved in cell wall biosynthesis [Lacinutrix venerupis]